MSRPKSDNPKCETASVRLTVDGKKTIKKLYGSVQKLVDMVLKKKLK